MVSWRSVLAVAGCSGGGIGAGCPPRRNQVSRRAAIWSIENVMTTKFLAFMPLAATSALAVTTADARLNEHFLIRYVQQSKVEGSDN